MTSRLPDGKSLGAYFIVFFVLLAKEMSSSNGCLMMLVTVLPQPWLHACFTQRLQLLKRSFVLHMTPVDNNIHVNFVCLMRISVTPLRIAILKPLPVDSTRKTLCRTRFAVRMVKPCPRILNLSRYTPTAWCRDAHTDCVCRGGILITLCKFSMCYFFCQVGIQLRRQPVKLCVAN